MTKQNTQSRMWIAVILALVIIGMYADGILAQSGTLVGIKPDDVTLYIGQSVQITVEVQNVVNLNSVELFIVFDPNLLEVVDTDPQRQGVQVSAGGFLQTDYETTNKVENGRIEYTLEQIPPTPPASGSGALLRITFRAIGVGTSEIMIDELYLGDEAGYGIASMFYNGRITVQSASVGESPPTPISPTPIPPAPVSPTPVPPPPIAVAPIAQPPAPAETVAVTGAGYNCAAIQGYHIVRRGETLYAIARAYATNPYAIGACNPTVNPRRIHAGNHLAIPYAPWTPPAGPMAERQFGPSLTPAPVPPPAPGCRVRHVVQPRETLTAIGLRHNADVWNIARTNRIYNLHLIHAGQVLCIP